MGRTGQKQQVMAIASESAIIGNNIETGKNGSLAVLKVGQRVCFMADRARGGTIVNTGRGNIALSVDVKWDDGASNLYFGGEYNKIKLL